MIAVSDLHVHGLFQDMSVFLEEEVIRKAHVEVIVVGEAIVLG